MWLLFRNGCVSNVLLWCGFVLPDITLADLWPPWRPEMPRTLKQNRIDWLCSSVFPLDGKLCWKIFQSLTKWYPSLLNPLHLLWMKSALHPSSGPPADASCSCTLFPVCTQRLLSEDVATAKLGHQLNLNGAALNGAMLIGWQDIPLSTVLFLLWIKKLVSSSSWPEWQFSQSDTQRWIQDHVCFGPFCVLQKIWVWLVLLASTAVGCYSWLTCGINSLSDELPWLDLKEDVYDWGLFLLRPPPQLPAC